jgi:hypothetical protein
MQYPYRVIFVEQDNSPSYLVRANDSRQAVSRARRRYEQENGGRRTQGQIRVRGLTPKKMDDLFYPRIGGEIIGDACATEKEALDIAIRESFGYMTKGLA